MSDQSTPTFEAILADPSQDFGPIRARLCDDDGTVRSGVMHEGIDYACTGSAHYKGMRLLCSNAVHGVEFWPGLSEHS